MFNSKKLNENKMHIQKNINLFTLLSLLFSICMILNLNGLEERSSQGWTEVGDIWREITKTQWTVLVENKTKDNAVLHLDILKDHKFDIQKTPLLTIQATPGESRTEVITINLPAIYHIWIQKDKCKWEFSPGSLLSPFDKSAIYSSDAKNEKCILASAELSISYDKKTKKGEITVTLLETEEEEKPIP
ncbi:MAG: hypothetical protein C5B43_04925 [Verrucomicrobia bacterium]|nr:MAG: hypothetical protein C5B43_04925 [Verrucomicrobiota bacterium]